MNFYSFYGDEKYANIFVHKIYIDKCVLEYEDKL